MTEVLLAEDQTHHLPRTHASCFGARRPLPALLVNHALEKVQLRLDGDRWALCGRARSREVACGPRTSPPTRPACPLGMATAPRQGGDVVVHLPDAAWNATLLPSITDALTAEGGLVLI